MRPLVNGAGVFFAQAIPAYEKAVELDPGVATAHFFLARAYIKSKQL